MRIVVETSGINYSLNGQADCNSTLYLRTGIIKNTTIYIEPPMPNPTNNSITLKYQCTKTELEMPLMQIFNLFGERIGSSKAVEANNSNNLHDGYYRFEFVGESNDLYFVLINDGSDYKQFKVYYQK